MPRRRIRAAKFARGIGRLPDQFKGGKAMPLSEVRAQAGATMERAAPKPKTPTVAEIRAAAEARTHKAKPKPKSRLSEVRAQGAAALARATAPKPPTPASLRAAAATRIHDPHPGKEVPVPSAMSAAARRRVEPPHNVNALREVRSKGSNPLNRKKADPVRTIMPVGKPRRYTGS